MWRKTMKSSYGLGEWQAWVMLLALFLMMVLCVWVVSMSIEREVQKIDENGGLKALVSRAWEGSPDGPEDKE
jgi:hypothetical protein